MSVRLKLFYHWDTCKNLDFQKMRTIQNCMGSIVTEYLNASQGNNARTNNSKPVTLMDLEHIPPYFNIAKIM